jgi:hypothetical protein
MLAADLRVLRWEQLRWRVGLPAEWIEPGPGWQEGREGIGQGTLALSLGPPLKCRTILKIYIETCMNSETEKAGRMPPYLTTLI